MVYQNSLEFARTMDSNDPLQVFRQYFHIPSRNGREAIYLCGNSLGLQPTSAAKAITDELTSWAELAVEGHFEGARPWMTYHKLARKGLASLCGAKESEVVAMNSLTVNLHLMLVSFYQPRGKRKKILIETGAFPSDQYAVESHLRWHGLDPEECIVEVQPDLNENLYSTAHLVRQIEKTGEELALVLFSGVQYYTGQWFDIPAITQAAHAAGALAGFDLAHAIGNVPLKLHKWQADFAAWCSYKYLNSGPGGVSGVYIHEKHATNQRLSRFGGWWGHDESERFLMKKGFKPIASADGWQLSNAPILLLAPHLASLELFDRAGMGSIRRKSIQLTGYLEFLLTNMGTSDSIQLITPADPHQRGCQLSIYLPDGNKEIFKAITRRGVIADWREPNVIRVAPAPLYNSFVDVFTFASILAEELKNLKSESNV